MSSTASIPSNTTNGTTNSSSPITAPSNGTKKSVFKFLERSTSVALLLLFCLLGYRQNSLQLQVVGGARGLDNQEEGPSSLTTEISALKHTPVCSNFFTVLADVWVQSEGNCTDVYTKYQPLMEEHDRRMKAMDTTLTVFTTWSPEALKDEKCAHFFDYLSNIKMEQFDPEPLLLKHGFSETQVNWMKHWQDTAPRFHHTITRLSDVFRIALAKETHLAYTDLDVVHIINDKRVYLDVANVAVPIWKEDQGALEIQNSAFCFAPQQLDVLLEEVRRIMNRLGDIQLTKNRYIYTQFGPNLFQHCLQKMSVAAPLQLYFTHSDDHWKVEDVKKVCDSYGGFVWYHFDSSNRRRNWYLYKRSHGGDPSGYRYKDLVQEYMKACPPPNITQVLPERVLEAYT